MLRELMVVPLIGLVILGFTVDLAHIAQSTSAKALNYADQMNSAVDCAFQGRAISQCSPDLLSTSFEPDAQAFTDRTEQYLAQIKELQAELNATNTTAAKRRP